MSVRSKLVLARVAIRNRYPMSAEVRQELLDAARRIMNDPEAPERARVGAMKVLLEADKVNLAATNIDVNQAKIEAGKQGLDLTVVDCMKMSEQANAALDRQKETNG